jgi:hypothetical protein
MAETHVSMSIYSYVLMINQIVVSSGKFKANVIYFHLRM